MKTLEQILADLPVTERARVRAHIPNAETIAALEEAEAGLGRTFIGTTAEMFAAILAEAEESAASGTRQGRRI